MCMEFKNILIVVCFCIGTDSSLAQMPQPPKTEFALLLNAPKVTLQKGQSDSVKISVIRSKAYKKGLASLSFSSPSYEGLSITTKPIVDQPDTYMIHVSASEVAKPGDYNILPACTLRNKTKAVVLKVSVNK
jgi:hypothetical protein